MGTGTIQDLLFLRVASVNASSSITSTVRRAGSAGGKIFERWRSRLPVRPLARQIIAKDKGEIITIKKKRSQNIRLVIGQLYTLCACCVL